VSGAVPLLLKPTLATREGAVENELFCTKVYGIEQIVEFYASSFLSGFDATGQTYLAGIHCASSFSNSASDAISFKK